MEGVKVVAASRVLYRDVVPYHAPESLDALQGPAHGVIEVPVTVHWGPQSAWNLDVEGEAVFAYQQLVREGTPPVQTELLNAEVLKRVWPRLVLPERSRQLWESRFPELAES